VIEGWSIEEKNTLHVSWKLSSGHEPAHGFIVRLFDSARRLVCEKNITSISVLSARIGDLEFNKEYWLEVLVYHCTSLGPPSDLYKVMINSKGRSSRTQGITTGNENDKSLIIVTATIPRSGCSRIPSLIEQEQLLGGKWVLFSPLDPTGSSTKQLRYILS